MGRHDHTIGDTLGPYRYFRTIVQATHYLTLWTLLDLIRGKVQTRLDKRVIENAVVFATRHKSKANQVGEDCPGAILAVEPQQGKLLWEMIRCEIALNRREALAEFYSIAPVTPIAKTAQPV